MGTTLNRDGYKKLIDEDLWWLLNQLRTLERDHIELVLRDSIGRIYGEPPQAPASGEDDK